MNNSFLSTPNIKLLWDLISEEPSIRDLSMNKQELAYNTFIQNINLFYKNESENENKDNLQLVTLNKKFLTIMLQMIRNVSKPISNTNANIISEPSKKYKIEDIQTDRQKMFEMQLNQRKNEFEQYNIPKKPPVPNFTETIDNEKIKNIDELIAQAITQRNFDIQPLEMPITPHLQSNTQLKYIQIQEPVFNSLNTEIIDLNPKELTDNTTIFGKFKTIKETNKEDIDLKTKLENLETKIDELTSIIKQIYNKINIEST
jgi:hypothetical protein